MRQNLLDSVSLSVLYTMRAEGMSNEDIARSLGVTSRTIYAHIGKQGKRMERIKALEPPQYTPAHPAHAEPVVQPHAIRPKLTLSVITETLGYTSEGGTQYKAVCDDEDVVLSGVGDIIIPRKDLAEFAQFCFAVACRMEARDDLPRFP